MVVQRTPMPSHSSWMVDGRTLGEVRAACRVPGWPWWPVMAVVRLSRISTSPSASLYEALMSAVMPEWKKVESPMTAAGRLAPERPG